MRTAVLIFTCFANVRYEKAAISPIRQGWVHWEGIRKLKIAVPRPVVKRRWEDSSSSQVNNRHHVAGRPAAPSHNGKVPSEIWPRRSELVSRNPIYNTPPFTDAITDHSSESSLFGRCQDGLGRDAVEKFLHRIVFKAGWVGILRLRPRRNRQRTDRHRQSTLHFFNINQTEQPENRAGGSEPSPRPGKSHQRLRIAFCGTLVNGADWR